jgi:hypothetical protein
LPKKLTLADFIAKARKVHGSRYSYDRTVYVRSTSKVVIGCPDHGDFSQTPSDHLHGYRCRSCGYGDRSKGRTLSTTEWVERARQRHKKDYDYSKVHYTGHRGEKILIGCSEHGFWQTLPIYHMRGVGCPLCSQPSKGEQEVQDFLTCLELEFVTQYSPERCKNPKTGIQLRYDIFVPSLNLLVEFDGQQHFEPVRRSLSQTTSELVELFEDTQHRDCVKTEFAIQNNFRLLRISYKEDTKQSLTAALESYGFVHE